MSTTSFVMPNDLSDLCRVCLQLPEESQYLDLSTIYDEDDNLTYGECFTICTQIDLSAGEGVPHHLCKTCGLELQMSYDFHKKIEESKRVIEQCQREIAQQKEHSRDVLLQSNEDCNKLEKLERDQDNGLHHLIDNKYVISEDDVELAGTSQEMEDDGSVREHHHEEIFECDNTLVEEETDLEVLNKVCQNNITTNRDETEDVEVSNREAHEEELLDFQNMETLEEEAKVHQHPLYVATVNHNPTQENFLYCSELGGNEERYEQILQEETVIEEEISQDATDKWLDTLNDIDTQSIPNSDDTQNIVEISEIPKDNLKQIISINQEINTIKEVRQPNEKKFQTPVEMVHQTIFNQEALGQNDNLCSLSKKKKSTVCLICNKSFISHNKLSWHMRMHDKNRKRFVCPIEKCGRIYASKQACDLHYRQTHLDEGVICPVCHKVFSAKQTLEVHMRYHTREFPFQCNLCDRKFAQKGHLTQHVEVKHHNLRYICTEDGCGKIFQNSVSLRNHRYTHSSMPFKCNRCDKQYPQKNKLRAHLLQKHDVELSLDELESMRQFNIIKTRHAYVKVQTDAVKETVKTSSDLNESSETLKCED